MPLLALWFLAIDPRGQPLLAARRQHADDDVRRRSRRRLGADRGLRASSACSRAGSTATAPPWTMLLALAFGATAAGEFVREGARKPFTVRGVLYPTSLTPAEVARLRAHRRRGGRSVPAARRADATRPRSWARREGAPRAVRRVRQHDARRERARRADAARGPTTSRASTSRKLQRTKGFRPPFAGNAEEVEALVQLLRWRPPARPTSRSPARRARRAGGARADPPLARRGRHRAGAARWRCGRAQQGMRGSSGSSGGSGGSASGGAPWSGCSPADVRCLLALYILIVRAPRRVRELRARRPPATHSCKRCGAGPIRSPIGSA